MMNREINDTKNNYFLVKIKLNPLILQKINTADKVIEHYEDKFEPILNRMGAGLDTYVIADKLDNNYIVFLFKTDIRKRTSLLRNLIQRYIKPFNENENYDNKDFEFLQRDKVEKCHSITKGDFNETLKRCKEDKKMLIKGDYNKETGYSGKDISIFNDRKNWHPWETELHDMVFTRQGRIKPANTREIIFIEDVKGKAGKSTFFKFLYAKYGSEVGLLSEASSSQLKSNICLLHGKRVFLIDLPRTEDQSMNGLLNALEMLKNGLINSSMYGKANVSLMDPPWVIVGGNTQLPIAGFTPDRWKVFEINDKKALVDISEQKQKLAKKLIKFKTTEKQAELKRLEDRYKENLKYLSVLRSEKY